MRNTHCLENILMFIDETAEVIEINGILMDAAIQHAAKVNIKVETLVILWHIYIQLVNVVLKMTNRNFCRFVNDVRPKK